MTEVFAKRRWLPLPPNTVGREYLVRGREREREGERGREREREGEGGREREREGERGRGREGERERE
jgi:hypothetical protein